MYAEGNLLQPVVCSAEWSDRLSPICPRCGFPRYIYGRSYCDTASSTRSTQCQTCHIFVRASLSGCTPRFRIRPSDPVFTSAGLPSSEATLHVIAIGNALRMRLRFTIAARSLKPEQCCLPGKHLQILIEALGGLRRADYIVHERTASTTAKLHSVSRSTGKDEI